MKNSNTPSLQKRIDKEKRKGGGKVEQGKEERKEERVKGGYIYI